MRRRITWRTAAAISMLGLAPAIGAAFAGPAGASTKACADALGTQCGTFTESAYNAPAPGGDSGGLGWDVKGQSTASNTPLIEYKNYSPGRDPGTDLTKVEHYGAIPGAPSRARGIWYSIVFTPSGKWTSMCLSNPDNPGRDGTNLVLRSCNQQKWQAFLALPIPTNTSGKLCPAVGDPARVGRVDTHLQQQHRRPLLRPVQRGEPQVCQGQRRLGQGSFRYRQIRRPRRLR